MRTRILHESGAPDFGVYAQKFGRMVRVFSDAGGLAYADALDAVGCKQGGLRALLDNNLSCADTTSKSGEYIRNSASDKVKTA